MTMIMFMARAIGWGVARFLGVPEDVPVPHGELEHAHWDPIRREWFTHAEAAESSVAHAA
jgi:hypothetical protein